MASIKVTVEMTYPINTSVYATDENPTPSDLDCLKIDKALYTKGELPVEDIFDISNKISVSFSLEDSDDGD